MVHKKLAVWMAAIGLSIVFVWTYLLFSEHTSKNTIPAQICADWKNASSALLGSCLGEIIEDIPFEELPHVLERVLPLGFSTHNSNVTADRLALSLFSTVEYSVVRRCVFGSLQHPYCDSQAREEAHRIVDAQLTMMLSSKDDAQQYQGMMLACSRTAYGRHIEIPSSGDARVGAVAYFVSLCTEDPQIRKQILLAGMQDSSVRTMALLGMIKENNEEWRQVVRSWEPQNLSPLEQSLVEHILHGAQE